MYRLRRIFHPEIFQGKYKTKTDYFEGWYFKIIDNAQDAPLAIIPGVSYQKDGRDNHAFIQIMDVKHGKVHYFRFPLSEFHADEKTFEVHIGDNYFSRTKLRLNIENEKGSFTGHLQFDKIVPFPQTLTNPGIMGPFTFIPHMECYHGIVNIHEEIQGCLTFNQVKYCYDGGYGYIEKDWGTSFPEAWIWLQSNHFPEKNISLMFSYAKIPWLGKSFMGLISFLRIGEKLYRFGTYTRAKIDQLTTINGQLAITLSDKHHVLTIQVENGPGGKLRAPKNGLMAEEIRESISGIVHVSLKTKGGEILYQGTGVQTGVEISDGMEKMLEESK
jgi:tocopherol cyclase